MIDARWYAAIYIFFAAADFLYMRVARRVSTPLMACAPLRVFRHLLLWYALRDDMRRKIAAAYGEKRRRGCDIIIIICRRFHFRFAVCRFAAQDMIWYSRFASSPALYIWFLFAFALSFRFSLIYAAYFRCCRRLSRCRRALMRDTCRRHIIILPLRRCFFCPICHVYVARWGDKDDIYAVVWAALLCLWYYYFLLFDAARYDMIYYCDIYIR